MLPEKTVSTAVDKWLKAQPDVFFFNVQGSPTQKRGIADRVGNVGPIGFYLELKAPGEKATKLQAAIGREIQKSGGNFFVADSFDSAVRFIEGLRKL